MFRFFYVFLSISLSLSLARSLTLSLPLCALLFLVNHYKWKALESRSRKTSVPLLCCTKTEKEDTKRRSKTVISQENHKRRSALLSIACLQLVGSVLFCALVRRGYTVELLHVPCSLFSSMSTRKFEGRREKGIEGMSWGKDNKGGINCSSSVGKNCA